MTQTADPSHWFEYGDSSGMGGDELAVENLEKHFEDMSGERRQAVKAVDDVSFVVEPGSLFTLLGPSGCGKTTTLRSVAGLEQPESGTIRVGDRMLFSSKRRINLAPNNRRLGMVFQSYAIWPHMTVEQNLSFPLQATNRSAKLSRKQIETRIADTLEMVQLGHLRRRPATDLSGGQQQRLALARALVVRPPLLLLDEPLSNLDAKLREDMRVELKNLQRNLGITALYVTHDQIEALAMSTMIAVMNNGRIEQVGRPRQIYREPVSHFVANFVGACNFIDATVKGTGPDDTYVVDAFGATVEAKSAHKHSVGQRVQLAVRPENIVLTETAGDPSPADASELTGVTYGRAYLGEAVEHVIDHAGGRLRTKSHSSRSIAPGTEVRIRFMPGGVRIVADSAPSEGEQRPDDTADRDR